VDVTAADETEAEGKFPAWPQSWKEGSSCDMWAPPVSIRLTGEAAAEAGMESSVAACRAHA